MISEVHKIMERNVSAASILCIVLIALALIIGIGFGVFVLTRGSATEGNEQIAEQTDYAVNSWREDYNDKEITGAQALVLLNNSDSKNISVFLDAPNVDSTKLPDDAIILSHENKKYINYGVEYDYNGSDYTTEEAEDGVGESLLSVRDSSSYHIDSQPKLINGNLQKNKNYSGVFTEGAVNYINIHDKYKSKLIYDAANVVTGVILTKVERPGYNSNNIGISKPSGGTTGDSTGGTTGGSTGGNIAGGNIDITPGGSTGGNSSGSTGGTSGDSTPVETSIFTVNSTGETITGFSSHYKGEVNIVIPSELFGVTITSIGKGAFKGSDIKTVSISDTVTSIGAEAFMNTKLESVSFSKNIDTLGESVFYGTLLTSVEIPSKVTVLPVRAFKECNLLKTVVLPDTLRRIEYYAFVDCFALENINTPSSLEYMGEGIFWTCRSLSSPLISPKLSSISWSSYRNCLNMKTITIPGNIKVIQADAFIYNGVQSLKIAEGFEELSYSSLKLACDLKELYLPKTLKKVGVNALESTNNLRNIYYAGTEEEWNNIEGIENLVPPGAHTVHFNVVY